jgi:hypothetical protein
MEAEDVDEDADDINSMKKIKKMIQRRLRFPIHGIETFQLN